jgi:hypothetical protein
MKKHLLLALALSCAAVPARAWDMKTMAAFCDHPVDGLKYAEDCHQFHSLMLLYHLASTKAEQERVGALIARQSLKKIVP